MKLELTMTELDAADCGRIIAALEAYAEEHPEADVLLDLADKIANCRVHLDCPPD